MNPILISGIVFYVAYMFYGIYESINFIKNG